MATRIKTGGRQKGTPNKTTAEIRYIAGMYAVEAIQTMVNIMRTTDNDALKLKVCEMIINRGYGAPSQTFLGFDPNKAVKNPNIIEMDLMGGKVSFDMGALDDVDFDD